MVCSEAKANDMSSGDRKAAPRKSPAIGTAWLTTRRFGVVYIEPVLILLTGIEPAPDVRSFAPDSSASSYEFSVTIQPCCQP